MRVHLCSSVQSQRSILPFRLVVALVVWGVLIGVCAGLQIVQAQDESSSAPRPNVLLIVSDDQGWNDIGYHNKQIRTPRLDHLAAEGVTLDQFYVHPQCTPTRLALMTGRYASRFHPRTWTWTNEQAIPTDILTIAEMFGAAGYVTGISGKWHLGSKSEWGPNEYGFDYGYGSLAGGVGIYDHRYRLTRPEYADTWHRNGTLINEMGHRTTLTADEVVKWIRQHREDPWFFYVPFHAPHTPLAETNPTWWQMTRHFKKGSRQLYAASLAHMDAAVGRIVETLEQTDQRGETVIVFFSDNGAALGAYEGGGYPPPDPELAEEYSSNEPLRAGKTHVYEGGIRVPAFVNWEDTLSPSTVEAPIHVVDWMPTMAALIGADPREVPDWDGRNVWPLLANDRAGYEEARKMYWVWGDDREREAVRKGAWKLVREDGSSWELYQLSEDPREQNDLFDTRLQKRKELLELYKQERRSDWGEQRRNR